MFSLLVFVRCVGFDPDRRDWRHDKTAVLRGRLEALRRRRFILVAALIADYSAATAIGASLKPYRSSSPRR
jgi:hypothetical protein